MVPVRLKNGRTGCHNSRPNRDLFSYEEHTVVVRCLVREIVISYGAGKAPGECDSHIPTYFAYRLRATPMSLVPLIMARPSGKIVIS
jgi:hypothetical protein